MSLEAWEASFQSLKEKVEAEIDYLREKMSKSTRPEKYQKQIDAVIELFESSRQRQLAIFAEKQQQLPHQPEQPQQQVCPQRPRGFRPQH